VIEITQHDTAPALEATLSGQGGPADLTTAATIHAIATHNGATLFDRTVTGNASGVITLPWQVGDTDTVGLIQFEFKVTWQAGGVQTFRAGYVNVVKDPVG
jgi:hypothetical protein